MNRARDNRWRWGRLAAGLGVFAASAYVSWWLIGSRVILGREAIFGAKAPASPGALTTQSRVERAEALARKAAQFELAEMAKREVSPLDPQLTLPMQLTSIVHSALARESWTDHEVETLSRLVERTLLPRDVGPKLPEGSSYEGIQHLILSMIAAQKLIVGGLTDTQEIRLASAIYSLSQSALPEDRNTYRHVVMRNVLWTRPGWLEPIRESAASDPDEAVRTFANQEIERLRRKRLLNEGRVNREDRP